MRKYIRHPTDIPIEYDLESLDDLLVVVRDKKEYLCDISIGGLLFKSSIDIKPGNLIRIKIPLSNPVFEITGKVVWCKKKGDSYNIGVEFISRQDSDRTRMVEQVCYIESYRQRVMKEEGRFLSGEEAAAEWISKFAADFPR